MSAAAFDEYVRSAMSERNITMAELGRRSGIDPGVIHSWLRHEKRPRRTTLRPVAAVLKLTPEQLLAVWDGDKPSAGRRTNESDDPVAQAIKTLVDRLDRLEASQVEGFDAVLKAIAATLGGPEPTGTSPESGRASRAGTGR